ncbi:hypothetical protein BJX76DRAFT_332390 [Aspergillus varians]
MLPIPPVSTGSLMPDSTIAFVSNNLKRYPRRSPIHVTTMLVIIGFDTLVFQFCLSYVDSQG